MAELDKNGDRMLGPLELDNDPVGGREAATKDYVDDEIGELQDEPETLDTVTVRNSLKGTFVAWSLDRPVSGYGYYEVEVSDSSSFSNILDSAKTQMNFASFGGIPTEEEMWARVRAVGPDGEVGSWVESNSDDTPGEVGDGETIHSDNYVAGEQGWIIEGAGDAEFNDIVARGTIENPGIEIDDDRITLIDDGEVRGVIQAGTFVGASQLSISGEAETVKILISESPVADASILLEGPSGIDLDPNTASVISHGQVINQAHTQMNDDCNISGDLDVSGDKNALIVDPDDGDVGYRFGAVEFDTRGTCGTTIHNVEVDGDREVHIELPEHFSRIGRDPIVFPTYAAEPEDNTPHGPWAYVIGWDDGEPEVVLKAPPGYYHLMVLFTRDDRDNGWEHVVDMKERRKETNE